MTRIRTRIDRVGSLLNLFTFIFRPPFINGRPQDSDSVFWKSHYPQFLSQSVPFSFASFFIHFICKKESPGVTSGHQGVPLGYLRFPWVPLGSLGFPWVPLGSLGFPWVPLG